MRLLQSSILCWIAISACAIHVLGQSTGVEIKLVVPQGTPLRVALQERVRIKHPDEPVRAILTKSVYAFDQAVIPAGTEVHGKISRIDAIPRKTRILAIADGNFTPSHAYGIAFDSLLLPNGARMAIDTEVSPGAAEVIHLVSGSEREKQKSAADRVAVAAKKQVNDAIHSTGVSIKSPGRLARIKRYLAAQLPFRRQYLEVGTEFNAALGTPLDFGIATRTAADLTDLGTFPADGRRLEAWLAAEVSSATAGQGTPVEAVVSEPLFSADHKLLVPANSKLVGEVVQARPARKLHHNGLLRIALRRIEFPDGVVRPVRTNLESVDVDRTAGVKLDAEGGAQAADSKGRYVSTGLSVAIAAMLAAPDNLEPGEAAVKDPEVRTAGGGSALRLAGAVAGFAIRSRGVSIALGGYGAASSVYSQFLAKGRDVTFPKNTPVEIGFEAP